MIAYEKQIDRYIVDILQLKKIDFLHLTNATSQKSASYKTHAFGEPYPCKRYFSDFIFPFGGKCHLLENGIMHGNTIAHKDRKKKQFERMVYWSINGCCSIRVITSINEAEKYLKEIGILT
jgi:hypothetical protein